MIAEIPEGTNVPSINDPLRPWLERCTALVYILVSTFSFAFLSPKTSWGVAAGGGLALLSFIDLRRTVEKFSSFLLSGRGKAEAFFISRFFLKLVLLAMLIFLLLKSGKVDAIGLAIGLLVLPAAMLIAGLSLYAGYAGKYAGNINQVADK